MAHPCQPRAARCACARTCATESVYPSGLHCSARGRTMVGASLRCASITVVHVDITSGMKTTEKLGARAVRKRSPSHCLGPARALTYMKPRSRVRHRRVTAFSCSTGLRAAVPEERRGRQLTVKMVSDGARSARSSLERLYGNDAMHIGQVLRRGGRAQHDQLREEDGGGRASACITCARCAVTHVHADAATVVDLQKRPEQCNHMCAPKPSRSVRAWHTCGTTRGLRAGCSR